MRRSLEVCLTHELLPLYSIEGKTVVVVDILRATSVMVTALAEGVESITPVASTDECKILQEQGYLAAAERSGDLVPGFDLGNSPLNFVNNDYSGRKLAMTTTNGTLAITRSIKASEVLIGAFLNISALTNYLKNSQRDLLILCAGWKGKVSYEDTLFAGALASNLLEDYHTDCDSAQIAMDQYNQVSSNLLAAIQKSAHYSRLIKLDIKEDFKFCTTRDLYDIVPKLFGKELKSVS
ncbi:MAG: 2-phosphosulfolactate phosphatase [Cyclobacteriaceae bacterium]